MSDERPEISTKWQKCGKLFWTLVNDKSTQIKVPEYLGHWSRNSEIIYFFILEVSLSLT